MDDLRKKVIKGLKCLAGMNEMQSNPCMDFGYQECQTYAICIGEIARDTLSMLKEQEPQKVKNIIGTAVSAIGDCPICGVQLHTAFIPGQIKTKFCYNCGKAVKWE